MLRILHTAHTYSPEVNGVAEVVKQISTRLARRGHDVHVATRIVVGEKSAREEILGGVHVHRFEIDGNAVTGMRGELDRYVQFVRSGRWDVLAMHCAQDWPTDALLPHLGRIDSARIFVAHGLSAYGDPAYVTYFDDLARQLKGIEGLVGLSVLTEEASFYALHVMKEARVIPNGADPAEWAAASRGVRKLWGIGGRPWLLGLSNHNPWKNHPAFFDVMRRIRERRPDATGTIIGGHYPMAKWRLGRFGVKGGCWYRCHLAAWSTLNVELRSGVPRADVISAVQEADVVLIPSKWEASPLVALESMAAGTPWVAFDVGCIRESVGGIVVASAQEMADTALDLLEDPEHLRELGREGRVRIEEKHDWERIADQYEDLYYSTTQQRAKNKPKTVTP